MPQFRYKARDANGKPLEAVMTAKNATEVRERLVQNKYFVLDITAIDEKASDPLAALNKMLEKKVTTKDLTVFSRQLSTMTNAGVNIARALAILAMQTENPKLKKAIGELKIDVESGSELSAALAKHTDIFDKLYVSMVKAAEVGGIMDIVLNKLAELLEKKAKLESQVKSAMSYPVTVLVISIGIFIALLVFLLPIFAKMFKEMGAKLPGFTQALIDMSNFVISYWYIIIIVGVGGFIAFQQYAKTPKGKYNIDKQMMKAPILGDIIVKNAVASFTRTFGTLTKAGVNIIQALEIVGDTAGNEVMAEALNKVKAAVQGGSTLSKPLEETKVFPAMVSSMIAIGEETGALDEMLTKIADFYDSEVEAAVEALTSLLEPIMIVGVGGMVGSIVVGMYLPIFSIIQNIK